MSGRSCRNPACQLYAEDALTMCRVCRNAWAVGRKDAEEADIPPQPANGAVVIDQDGNAWQRNGNTWDRARWSANGSSSVALNWVNLVRCSTSLRELH